MGDGGRAVTTDRHPVPRSLLELSDDARGEETLTARSQKRGLRRRAQEAGVVTTGSGILS